MIGLGLGVTLLRRPTASAPAVDAPVADFTADDTTPAADQTVTLTYTGTGSPDSYEVDWGDGTVNALLTHDYDTPGTYTVALTATNAGGNDTETKIDYIEVGPPLDPNLILTVTDSGGTPLVTTEGNHGKSTGNFVSVAGNDYPGMSVITVASPTTFTLDDKTYAAGDTGGTWAVPVLSEILADTVSRFDFSSASGNDADDVGGYTAVAINAPGRVTAPDGGNAADFNGTDQQFRVAGLLDTPPAEGVIAFWFRANSAPDGVGRRLLTKYQLAPSVEGADIVLKGEDGYKFRWVYFRNSVSQELISSVAPTVGRWHHVAVTWGGRGLELWIDGVLEDSEAGVTDPWQTMSVGADLAIGGYWDGDTATQWTDCSMAGLVVADTQWSSGHIGSAALAHATV